MPLTLGGSGKLTVILFRYPLTAQQALFLPERTLATVTYHRLKDGLCGPRIKAWSVFSEHPAEVMAMAD